MLGDAVHPVAGRQIGSYLLRINSAPEVWGSFFALRI